MFRRGAASASGVAPHVRTSKIVVVATLVTALTVTTAEVAGAGSPAPPLYSGGPATSAPVLYILCNWSSTFNYSPNSLSYYRSLWTNPTTAGYSSLPDYWRQVSFGQTNVNGSMILNGPHAVAGWYSMNLGTQPTSLLSYSGYGGGASPNRVNKIFACLDAASSDLASVSLGSFQSVVAVTPWVLATASSAINNGDTTIHTTSLAGWPTGAFNIFYKYGGFTDFTDSRVSSIDTATNTIHLASPWSRGYVLPGASIISDTSDDFGFVGPQTIYENHGVFSFSSPGTAFHVGLASLAAGDSAHGSVTLAVGDSAHETGHSFGYQHSRTMYNSVTDYQDCWDEMSYDACGTNSPSTVVPPNDGAIGMDAINLETQGWIPLTMQYRYLSGQRTIDLHALSDPNALRVVPKALLVAHIPATVTIEANSPSGNNPTVPPTCTGTGFRCLNSNYFTVEYRQPRSPLGVETWDFGAGALTRSWTGAVVIHLHTPPNPTGITSFQVNTDLNASTLSPLANNGGLSPVFPSSAGHEFVDRAAHVYVSVDAINTSTWTSTVTISRSPIVSVISYVGPVIARYGQIVPVTARVAVTGSTAPVPNDPIVFNLANGLSCKGVTNRSGIVKCQVTMTKSPETNNAAYDVFAKFPGDAAYRASSMVPKAFTITKAPLTVIADSFTRPQGKANPLLTAQLSGFVLGQSPKTSGVVGVAKCTTTADQSSKPGTYAIICTAGSLKSTNYAFTKFVAGTLTVTQ
jgi:hypothetical protein